MLSKSLSTSVKRAALHQVAGRLAEFAQSLYPLMVAHADDFGRLQGDLFTVKHVIDPSSPRKLEDFGKAMAALHQVSLIEWYEVNGAMFIQISNFEPHQIGLHKRTHSRFPESSGNFPEFPSELKELKGTEEKGTEVQNSGASAATLTPGEPASAPPPATTDVDAWKGQQSRRPADDGNFSVCVKLAHDVMDETGIENPDDPDLADALKTALAKSKITVGHDPAMPRRALASAASQRLQPARGPRRGRGSIADIAAGLRSASPAELSRQLKDLGSRRR